jgi:putative DNA methylase
VSLGAHSEEPEPGLRAHRCATRRYLHALHQGGKEAYIEPLIDSCGYHFTVKMGQPRDAEAAKNGTKLARGAHFRCVMSGTPITGDHIKAEGRAGRINTRLMAIVAEGERGRIYLPPTAAMEAVARTAEPTWVPEGSFVEDARAFTPCIYGLKEWRHLFTPRQLVALTTFSDLVQEARERVERDALAAGIPDDSRGLGVGGTARLHTPLQWRCTSRPAWTR